MSDEPRKDDQDISPASLEVQWLACLLLETARAAAQRGEPPPVRTPTPLPLASALSDLTTSSGASSAPRKDESCAPEDLTNASATAGGPPGEREEDSQGSSDHDEPGKPSRGVALVRSSRAARLAKP